MYYKVDTNIVVLGGCLVQPQAWSEATHYCLGIMISNQSTRYGQCLLGANPPRVAFTSR